MVHANPEPQATKLQWFPETKAPDFISICVIQAEVMCDCGKGGELILAASRMAGRWVIDCEHDIRIRKFALFERPLHFGKQ